MQMPTPEEFRALEESLWRAETDYANRSSVWVRDGEEWRILFHQGTPVRPE
jgi:hypothetical protein